MIAPAPTYPPTSDLDRPDLSRQRPKVAYLMSRFPKITETFVLYEVLAVEKLGVQVELYPLLRERTSVMHPEAAPLVRRAHFAPLLSWRIVLAHWCFLRRAPGAYLGALGTLLCGTWGSLRYFTGGLGMFPKVVYFARLMQAEGVTHVHAHFASHPAAAALVIHRLTGIPYSFTAHGSDLHRDRHMLREKVAEAAFVVTISDYNRELIVSESGEQHRHKVVVIHCGVDTSVFRPPPEDNGSQQDTRPPIILCIGTLHEVKGQAYLIEACRLLRQGGLDVACHLVGDGPDRAALAAQASDAGLADRVVLLGRRNRDQITALLKSADVVAAPSVPTAGGRREGIPVALMEAMAAGVPVVASDLSGIPELVEHDRTGLLVPPGDARALAAALRRMVAEPSLGRRLAGAAREKVLHHFDLFTNAAALTRRFHAGGRP